jgi:hypothetical protein
VPPTEQQLRQLQVKAELNKLGDAPRAYQDKLQIAEASMDGIDTSSSAAGGKLSINERFGKIQGYYPPAAKQGKTLRLVPRPKQAYQRRNN